MTSIKIPKAGAVIASQLRQKILRGELLEGDSLGQESELVKYFGVSRPTLREAFRMLEAEGLISISRGARGGATVHRPSVRIAARYMGFILQAEDISLEDVHATQIIIEPAAVRLVASNAAETAPAVLRKQWQVIENCLANDFQYGSEVAKFHLKLVELGGVRTLYLLTELVHQIQAMYISAATIHAALEVDTLEAKRKGQRVRDKLIKLIEKGDVTKAHDLWLKHMEVTGKMMKDWLSAKSVLELSIPDAV